MLVFLSTNLGWPLIHLVTKGDWVCWFCERAGCSGGKSGAWDSSTIGNLAASNADTRNHCRRACAVCWFVMDSAPLAVYRSRSLPVVDNRGSRLRLAASVLQHVADQPVKLEDRGHNLCSIRKISKFASDSWHNHQILLKGSLRTYSFDSDPIVGDIDFSFDVWLAIHGGACIDGQVRGDFRGSGVMRVSA